MLYRAKDVLTDQASDQVRSKLCNGSILYIRGSHEQDKRRAREDVHGKGCERHLAALRSTYFAFDSKLQRLTWVTGGRRLITTVNLG